MRRTLASFSEHSGRPEGPVESTFHVCWFIASPPQPWGAGLTVMCFTDGDPEAPRAWAWPLVGGGAEVCTWQSASERTHGQSQTPGTEGLWSFHVEAELALCSGASFLL